MLSRRAFPLSLAGLFAAEPGRAAEPAAAVWVCHEVPPHLSRTDKGYEGYAYHLFQRVARQAGLRVDLQYVPFARAFSMMLGKAAQGALVVTRSPDREAQFRWLYPVGRFRFALFTRMASPPPVAVDLATIKAMRLGSLRARSAAACWRRPARPTSSRARTTRSCWPC